MAWVNNFDTTYPDGSTQKVPVLDDAIKTLAKALQERLNVCIYFPLTGSQVSDTDAGKIRKVLYKEAITKPTLAAGEGALYTKTVSDIAELFWQQADGTEKQLTTGGKLNVIDEDTNNFLVPTGAMLQWLTNTAPTGWLLCYGQAVSRTTYSALFGIIGTTFGSGDGSTTFNLPDLRGRMPLGQDDMGGSSANRVTDTDADTIGGADGHETHTLTTAEMPGHTHTVGRGLSTGGTSNYLLRAHVDDTSITSGSTGGGGAHDNMPPFITVNYIIKY